VIVSGSIQWRCGVCNAARPVGTGGICVRCRKFACSRHLNRIAGDGEKREQVCSACLTGDDRVEKGLRSLLGRWFG